MRVTKIERAQATLARAARQRIERFDYFNALQFASLCFGANACACEQGHLVSLPNEISP